MKAIEFIRLSEDAKIPTRATEGSAGYDLYSTDDEVVPPNSVVLIYTGLMIHIKDKNIVGLVYPRSGLSARYGVTLANCVGVIDSDYQGEILLAFINHSSKDYDICRGDRVAQLLFTPVFTPEFREVYGFIEEPERGTKGFGSTGK